MNIFGQSPSNFFDPISWIIGICIFIIVFIVLREFFCWYWKINQIVNLLESINQRLSKSTLGETTEAAGKEEEWTNTK